MTEAAVDGTVSPIFHRYDFHAPRMSQKQRRMNSGPIVKHVGLDKKGGSGGTGSGDKKKTTKK